jgi:hypothetical protein
MKSFRFNRTSAGNMFFFNFLIEGPLFMLQSLTFSYFLQIFVT